MLTEQPCARVARRPCPIVPTDRKPPIPGRNCNSSKSYDAACLDLRCRCGGSAYDLPCLSPVCKGQGSFSGARRIARSILPKLFTAYRQQGLVSASLASLTITALSEDFARGETGLVIQRYPRSLRWRVLQAPIPCGAPYN